MSAPDSRHVTRHLEVVPYPPLAERLAKRQGYVEGDVGWDLAVGLAERSHAHAWGELAERILLLELAVAQELNVAVPIGAWRRALAKVVHDHAWRRLRARGVEWLRPVSWAR